MALLTEEAERESGALEPKGDALAAESDEVWVAEGMHAWTGKQMKGGQ